MAQPLPEAAASALQEGQLAASEAQRTYEEHHVDQPLWQDALAHGHEAAELAPDHPAPRRFLAQAYDRVGWYARAWEAWTAYRDRDGTMDAQARRQFVEVAAWLGFRAFESEPRRDALPYLEAILEVQPGHLGAHERLARWWMDAGEPERAIPHLETLSERVPEYEAVLQEARGRAEYGPEAYAAFQRGEEAFDADDLEAAREAYQEAVDANDELVEAHARLGRIAFEQQRYGQAVEHYSAARRLAPGESTYASYAAQASQLQQRALEAEAQRLEQRAREAEAAAEEAQVAALEEARQAAEQEAAAAQQEAAEAAEAAAQAQAEEDAEAAAQDQAQEDAEAAAAEAEAQQEAAQESQPEAEAPAEEESVEAALPQPEPEAPEPEPEPAPPAEPEDEAEAEPEPEAEPAPEPGPSPAADPLVLVDRVVDHTMPDVGGSGAFTFLDASGVPRDLGGYASAVLHQRVEVLEKPSEAAVRYQMCLVPQDIQVEPACSDATRLQFQQAGTYQATQEVNGLNGVDALDWEEGLESLMLVVRGDDGEPVDGRFQVTREAREALDLDAYYPMRVHVQAILVPDGSEFPGWP